MAKEKKTYLFDNKALAKLAFPLFIEQLLAVFVGMADSIMIAQVGEAAVSGISLVDSVMILFINLFGALATGGAVIAGQYLGAKNTKQANEAAEQLLQFVLIFSLVITSIIYLGKKVILYRVFGSIEADVAGYANTYLMIVTASVPFIALYNGGAAIFRTLGNSSITMVVSMIMNLINVVGNAVLIFGFHMGAEGVAIPTLVSRMAAAFLILYMLNHKEQLIRIRRVAGFPFNWNIIGKVLKIGVPNGLENSMFQMGKILVLSLVSSFGTASIAANAVCNSVAGFQVLPGMAMNMAIITVIARCVGAGDYDQAKYYTKKLLSIVYVAMLVINTAIYFLLPTILHVYNLTDETAGMARQILVYHTFMACIFWPLSFSLPCTLRAAGDAKVPMIIAVSSMWMCRIVLSYVIGKYMGWGVFGVWVAMTMDWLVRIFFMGRRYLHGHWMELRAI